MPIFTNNDMKSSVKIFATTTCAFCKPLKLYLEKIGITYSEVFVDKDKKALKEMVEESNGYLGVPFIVITKDGCTKIKIKGFDVCQINTTLGV
jgi:glutaredoxin